MSELARLYAQIALLQRGPQDVPASALLLALTVLAYFLVNAFMYWVLPDLSAPWLTLLLLDIVVTAVWYAAVLRSARKPERILQTTSAVFGYRTVLSPLLIIAGWLVQRFATVPSFKLPLGIGCLALAIWAVAANSHVLKSALEWPLIYCAVLVMGEIALKLLAVVAVVPAAR